MLIIDQETGEIIEKENEYAIVKDNEAIRSIKQSEDLNEVRKFMDVAKAATVFYEAQGDFENAQNAKIADIWSEWRAGGLLKSMPKNEGTKGNFAGSSDGGVSGGFIVKPPEEIPTLDDLDIDKNESYRWQLINDHSENEIQTYVDKKVGRGYEITTGALVKNAKSKRKAMKREKKIAERMSLGMKFDEVKLMLGDMKIVGSEIEDNSIDLILTDPPYPGEYLYCWRNLAELAKRVLKPSGFLITYSGQLYIPEVLERLNIPGLQYYWTFCLLHNGNNQLINARDVICGWKPIFVFQKEPFKKNGFVDVIQGSGREKSDHDWQQGVDEITYIIERFTILGDLILDPFAGSGTTLIAAKNNNRRSIGIEINEETYKAALGRINELQG